MFTDIELYKNDLKKYYKELTELDTLTDHETEKKAIDSKFKDKVRKYLPTCLNVINSTFNCKYSIYKEGKDYNASLQLVDTKVKKTKEEVQTELASFQNYVNINSLQPNDRAKLDLAMEILNVYVDDEYYNNVFQSKYIQEALALPDDDSTFEAASSQQAALIPQTTEIQYNPYAGQPIDYGNDSNFSNEVSNERFNITSLEPTSTDVNEGFKSNNYANDKDYAYSDVIDGSSLSIFNSVPSGVNNQNNNQ